jgi:hypothetical protein
MRGGEGLEIFLDWTGDFVEEDAGWVEHSEGFDCGDVLFYNDICVCARVKESFGTAIS